MLVDSHAHLDDPRFEDDRDAVLERAQKAGVGTILTIGNGTGPDDMGCGLLFAEAYDWIYTSVGVHPHDAARVESRHYELMKELVRRPRVLAIGETGLDYYYETPRGMSSAMFFANRSSWPAKRSFLSSFTPGTPTKIRFRSWRMNSQIAALFTALRAAPLSPTVRWIWGL